MAKRDDYRKAIAYTGQRIKGLAVISYKIDGCRVLFRGGKFVSRNNKPYPGLDIALTNVAKAKIRRYGDCEIFNGSFKATSGLLQQHSPEPNVIKASAIYSLVLIDPRLIICKCNDPTSTYIQMQMEKALELGYEGIVVRTNIRWYKVKPIATADVRITGYFEQMDKHRQPKGILGGFTTNYGNVTAFYDSCRRNFWKDPASYVGRLMAVQYRERYASGNFRYCVTFMHFRDDKNTESFDTAPPIE